MVSGAMTGGFHTSPSSRQVPDLAGEGHSQGSARSEAEGRDRRERPLLRAFAATACSARGGRPGHSGRRGPKMVRDSENRLASGAGERRGGGSPRHASPTQRQRAGPPPPGGETPRQPQPPTAGTFGPPNALSVIRANVQSPAGAGRPGAPKACHL